MGYIRAEDVLPSEVLALVQQYVDGQMLYIPKKDSVRKKWGSLSGTRESLEHRNTQIYRDYKAGKEINDLAEKYFLSVKSIQKIVGNHGPSDTLRNKEKSGGYSDEP